MTKLVLLTALILSELSDAQAAEFNVSATPKQQMTYLCLWVKSNLPADHRPKPCNADSISNASDGALVAAIEDFWYYWNILKGEKAKYDAFYLSLGKEYSHQRLLTEANASNLAKLPQSQLCAYWREKRDQRALILVAEKANFTSADMGSIEAGNVRLGMDQDALRCSLGEPKKMNRNVSRLGERIQWVFDATYVYTQDGIVTSFQD